MSCTRRQRRLELDRQLAEQLVVASAQRRAPIDPAVELGQLLDAHRGGDVVHRELEARFVELVVGRARRRVPIPCRAREPVQAHPLGAQGAGLVRDRERAALDRGHVLAGVEREGAGVAVSADRTLVPCRADRVRGVLDHRHPVLVAQGVEAVEVERAPAEVHAQHRAGARAEQSLDVVDVDQPGRRIDVGEHRRRAQHLDDVRAGGERQRRQDHLGVRADPRHPQRDQQRPGRRRRAAHVRPFQAFGQMGLEGGHARPAGDPPGSQRLDDGLDLLLADLRLRELEERRPVPSRRGTGRRRWGRTHR